MSTRTLAIIAACALACAAEHKASWEVKNPPPAGSGGGSEADYKQLVAQGDAAWAERGDKDKLMRAIYAWEGAVRVQPADWQTFGKLARATYLLADGFLNPLVIPDGDKAKYEEMHEKGIRYGELAMSNYSPEFRAKVQAGAKPEDAVELIGKDGIATMYWYAANLGRWANSKGFTTRLAQKDRILKIMRRCLELDSDFFYAAPHRYFGAFYAIAPSFAGGDLDKSLQHFQTAIQKSPNYFSTHVLFAENYATKKGDKDLFKKQLEFVLQTPENVLPDVVPEQRIEKLKAKRLLDQINE